MNSWSSRRKLLIFSCVLVVLLVVLGLPLYFYFHKAPSCTNGKMDGDETGIDCGGSCTTICTSNSLPLIMQGDPRVLPVATSTYAIAVEVQNPNVLGVVMHAGYTLKVYNASSSEPMQTIRDTTYIPKNSTFALFFGPFQYGTAPTRATLEWNDLTWVKDVATLPTLEVRDPLLVDAATKPRLTATLVNPSFDPVANIELVALVKDFTGNIIAASRTVVHSLASGESTNLIYTWPKGFTGVPIAAVVVPRIFPDATYLK